MAKERIDKIIARGMGISRSDAHALLKSGRVSINGIKVKSGNFKADSGIDIVSVDDQTVDSDKYVYIMLNKPKGVVSASRSEDEPTVVDLIPDEIKRKNLFPAGRLDKDTTGFVLITNDGKFAHDILSPSHHVEKTYIAELDGVVNEEICRRFENGITAQNGEFFKEAKLNILETDERKSICEIIITEGKYHQIKRMFAACGLGVTALHRTKIGGLELDRRLSFGECKRLSSKEIQQIQNYLEKIGK